MIKARDDPAPHQRRAAVAQWLDHAAEAWSKRGEQGTDAVLAHLRDASREAGRCGFVH